jgi:lysophospholipase L1-like esterase
MARRRWLMALVAGALLITTQPILASAADPPPLPASMAAVGDSISQAVSSGGSLGATYPANSWSTGSNTTVDSHYLRLLDLVPSISGHAENDAVSGADMADLQGQMADVVAFSPDYLTVLIGGNDLCTDTVDQMTPVATFRDQFVAAMDTLMAGSPDTRVLVASIPDVYQLWNLFRSNWWARTVWSLGGICQSLLANPTSTRTADVDRRAAVAQRNIDYNTVLAEVCAQYTGCRFDGGAVYGVQFAKSDVAGDYFHPSVAGQAKLAAVTWAAGYWPNGGPVTDTPPTAAFTSDCTDLTCTFDASTSSDDHGIATYAWTFGDGSAATGSAPSHTYGADGTYQVVLTVADTIGQGDTVTHAVTVSAPAGGGTVHLADLSGSADSRKGGWTATVTVSVADGGGFAFEGAVVSGAWSSGGSAGCTTDVSGSCSFTTNMNKKTKEATWTIAGIAASGYAYDPDANVGSGSISFSVP